MNSRDIMRMIRREIGDISLIAGNEQVDNQLSSREIDLLVSKARNLLDELDLLRNAIASPGKSPSIERVPDSFEEPKAPVPFEAIIPPPAKEKEVPKVLPATEETPMALSPEPDSPAPIETVPMPLAKSAEVTEPMKEPDLPLAESRRKPVTKPDIPSQPTREIISPVARKASKSAPSGSSVADKFSKVSPSLNDKLSQNKPEQDLASRLSSNRISDIRSAISLNEKLLFIRDLFSGQSGVFNDLVDHLNQAPDFETARVLVDQAITDQEHPETKAGFLQIVSRRFL